MPLYTLSPSLTAILCIVHVTCLIFACSSNIVYVVFVDLIASQWSSLIDTVEKYVTRKAITDLMALAIFDRQSVFNSLLRSHL